MPGKNGFDVLDEVNDEPELALIPIVMLTSSSQEEDVIKS